MQTPIHDRLREIAVILSGGNGFVISSPDNRLTMKHIHVILSFLVVMASSQYSLAQGETVIDFYQPDVRTDDKVKPNGTKKHKGKEASLNRNAVSEFSRSNRILSETKMIKVNMNAVRHFTRLYKNVNDAKWFETDGGYVASFCSNGTYTKIAYSYKGVWLYNLLEYTEANLSFEVRHMVKSRFYDHDILVIHQYEFADNKTVYLIRMQNQDSRLITLKVFDGEIEVITPRENN